MVKKLLPILFCISLLLLSLPSYADLVVGSGVLSGDSTYEEMRFEDGSTFDSGNAFVLQTEEEDTITTEDGKPLLTIGVETLQGYETHNPHVSFLLTEDGIFIQSEDSKPLLIYNVEIEQVTPGGDISGGDFALARITGSTFSTVQHLQDIFHSAGWVSGGGITDDADGTITVAVGTGLIRAIDGATAQILYTDWAAESGANVNLTDNDVSWVYVEYNSGSPRVIATTTERTDFNTNILLAVIQRTGTTLHINAVDKHVVGDHANGMIRRLKATNPFAHVSGGILSETGTRNIALTAGTFWQGLSEFTTSAVDTSGAPTFTYYYNDGAWQSVTTSDIHQTNYNNFGVGLATLSNNRYGVHWVYLEADDDDIAVVYGIGDYTLTQATDAQAPSSIPEHLIIEGILAGKIIIKKSDATFTQTESSFQTTFAGSLASDHGGLAGLSDVADHAYALLLDGSRALTGAWDMGSQILTNVNIDSGVITGITDLAIADGGTGSGTAQDAIDLLSDVSGATNEHVLTKDTGTGNAIWKLTTASGGVTAELDNLGVVAINTTLVSDTDITDNLGTGDVRWKDAWIETLSSGLTATDVLKLRARDIDGSVYVDILTITSANTVIADLNAITTIGSAAIVTPASTATFTNKTFDANGTGNSIVNVDLTADIIGTLPVADGGTGQITYINGQLLIGNTTGNTLTKATLTGTSEQITITNDTGTITISIPDPFNLSDGILQRPEIKDYSETLNTVGTAGATETLDLAVANVHDITLDVALTLTFSNPPASGKAGSFTLIHRQDNPGGNATIWPASVAWPDGSAPTMSTSADIVYIFTFITVDGGTIWHGMLGSANSS